MVLEKAWGDICWKGDKMSTQGVLGMMQAREVTHVNIELI